jgi:capsular exopolysaccharide synthesis family protein
LVARGTDEVNPLQDRLTSIEQQRTQMLIRRADMEGQLTSIQKAKQNRYDDQHLLALVTDLRNQATADNAALNPSTPLDAQLVQLADREQELLEHFGPNHPRVATVRQRIAAARKLLALPSTAYIQDPASPQAAGEARSDAETVELYTKYLEQELERIKVSEQLLTELYQQEHDTAKELSGYQLKDEGFRRNIDRTQQLYDGVVSQLQDASLIKGYGGFEARVIAEPLYGEKVSPRGKLVVAAALLAGMCLGFVLAVVGEMRDESFHSRHEIQARLGVAVMAQVPRFKAAAADERSRLDPQLILDPMLCAHFQPRSPQTEAFDALRTTLLFHQRSADRRVIQITSPSPEDGKSTIAANLAVTMAQLGRRVLVLDADLLRPRQQELFGVSADKGLCSLIREGHAPQQAIYATTIEGLSVLPVGPGTAAGPELFMSTRFAELLSWLRPQFDDVLIDTGPLLAVSDPCIVATQVDGVLLALKPTKDSRRRTERAKELLDAIDVLPLGVVVNGVGSRASRAYRDDLNLHDTTYTASVTSGAKRTSEQPGVSGSDVG